MNRIIKIVIALVFLTITNIYCQNPNISLSSESACMGDTILVPINFENLNNIGAISIFIEYDTNVLEFDTISNVHSLTPNVLSNSMPSINGGLQVGLVWSAFFAGANIGTAHWLDLQFIYKNDSCDLSFSNLCEIGDYNANVLNVDFLNGFINSNSLPTILSQPQNITATENQNVIFDILAENASFFQWQMNDGSNWINIANFGIFSGANTSELQISNVTLSLNNVPFRCYVEGCNSTFSNSASLFVDTFTGIEGNSAKSYFQLFQNYPNPFDETSKISFLLHESGNVIIKNISPLGETIMQENLKYLTNGIYEINIDADDFEKGVYFYELNFSSGNISISDTKKMLITR